MDKQILREMQKRIVKSFLDILVLELLKKEAKSAYGVVAFINKKFGILFSTGSVYSTLYSLERDGLIQGNFGNEKRRARVYRLTDKGEETIRAFLKVNDQIQLFVVNFLDGVSNRIAP